MNSWGFVGLVGLRELLIDDGFLIYLIGDLGRGRFDFGTS